MGNYSLIIKYRINFWYLLLIAGLIYIAAGIWVCATPLSSYLTLSMLFSISFLISGISEIIFAVSNRNELNSWGWKLILGILTTITGLVLLSLPVLSLTTLPLYIGFVFLFRSVIAIGFSIEIYRFGISKWGWLLFIGLVGLVSSCILIMNPVIAGITLIYTTGIALISLGIFSIYFSLQLNKLRRMAALYQKS